MAVSTTKAERPERPGGWLSGDDWDSEEVDEALRLVEELAR